MTILFHVGSTVKRFPNFPADRSWAPFPFTGRGWKLRSSNQRWGLAPKGKGRYRSRSWVEFPHDLHDKSVCEIGGRRWNAKAVAVLGRSQTSDAPLNLRWFELGWTPVGRVAEHLLGSKQRRIPSYFAAAVSSSFFVWGLGISFPIRTFPSKNAPSSMAMRGV